MKKLLPTGLLLFLMSGCGTSTPPEAESSAPAGFVAIKDAAGGAPAGTQIYTSNGELFGTVRAYDSNHKFAGGNVAMGTLVEVANGGAKMWMPTAAVNQATYVKAK